jgi:UDP-N-acetylglucosamine transferase subunit ALG13
VILVTVGTQFFDELIDEVDRLVAKGVIKDQVWAQIGLAKRPPQHIEYAAFDRHLADRARDADLIITHAGTGCVCEFIALGRPMIAVANQTKAGNHQLEFLEQLSQVYDLCWVASPSELEAALPHARPARPFEESALAPLADDIRAVLLSA